MTGAKLRRRIAYGSDRLVFMMRDPTWAQAYWLCARVRVRSRKVASTILRWAHGGFSRGGSMFSSRRSAEARHRGRRRSGTPHRPSFGSPKNRWLEQATVPSAVVRTEDGSPSGCLSRYSSRSRSRSKPRSKRCASSLVSQSSGAPSRSRYEVLTGSRVRREFAARALARRPQVAAAVARCPQVFGGQRGTIMPSEVLRCSW
jgi:hypothetical protein